MLHNTQFGLICPSETPEGERIGIVKNVALLCKVSAEVNPDYVKFVLNMLVADRKLVAYNVFSTLENIKNKAKVSINGTWFGFT